MVDSALACGECGAGLPPPDYLGSSACVYCGTEHLSLTTAQSWSDAHRVERPSWHDCGDAARIPLTEDAVLDLLRQHFADADSVFVCPHVPPPEEHAARHVHAVHLPARERILALHDRTGVLGGGHEGFVVTAKRICWKNPGEPARSVQWKDIDPDQLYIDGPRLFLGHDAIELSGSDVQDACANAFHVLALSGLPPQPLASGRVLARDTSPSLDDVDQSGVVSCATAHESSSELPVISVRRSATPPPPHTTSYFAYASHAQTSAPDCSCWHCHTPLYETTPQCAFCGAEPKPTGWLRTG